MSAYGDDIGLRPVTDDPDTAGFFEAAREHRLVVQTCEDCGHQQQPPRPRCRACHGNSLGWQDVPHEGTVHTWTVVEHQINPAFPAPYTSILVDVVPSPGDAPIRFLGYLPGRPSVQIGTPVQTQFVDFGDDVTVPNWALIDPS